MSVAIITTLLPYKNSVAVYSTYLVSELSKDIRLVIITNKGAKKIKNADMIYALSPANPIATAIEIFKELRRRDIKVVHIHWWLFLFQYPIYTMIFTRLLVRLLKLAKVKIIVTLHAIPTREAVYHYFMRIEKLSFIHASLIYIFTIRSLKFIIRNTDVIIVHNNIMKKILVKSFKVDPNKIIIIPHGVFEPKKISDPTRRVRVIFAPGFITRERNFEMIIKAFFDLLRITKRKMFLVIAGQPRSHDAWKYVTELKKLVKSYGIEDKVIILPKFLSDYELENMVNASDIIVISDSDKFIRSSGNLARVIGYGKPIVIIDSPKFRTELTNNEDAIFFEPHVDDLTLALLRLVYDDDLRNKLSKNLRRKALKRSWKDIAKYHMELYKQMTLKA